MDKETIRPSSLGKRGVDMDATGTYDWEKQAYRFACAKFGTYNSTRNGTSSYIGSSSFPSSDDSNTDSYND